MKNIRVLLSIFLFITISLFFAGCQQSKDKNSTSQEINIDDIKPFTVTINSFFELDGKGINIDSIAFWEAPNPSDTLMFVTAKGNKKVEVWKYPFQNNELDSLTFNNTPNGVVVDQKNDELLIGEYDESEVSVYSLPSLKLRRKFGKGILGEAETNLDILFHTTREVRVYVSDSHTVYAFRSENGKRLYLIVPPVTSIETVLADDYYQVVYIPEENGGKGKSPGIHAYHPNGTPYKKNGTNVFGHNGIFRADEEGILLYTCPTNGLTDQGSGFIVVADQSTPLSEFEFFDRKSWKHLGTVKIKGVKNTDGIASTQKALPEYPKGIFSAVDNDASVAIVGWDVILDATGLHCKDY